MVVLEIVQLRSTSLDFGDIANELARCLTGADPGNRIQVFRRIDVQTDLSIHIHHVDSGCVGPSSLGERFSSELRRHGMVLHTLWSEQDIRGGGDR
jgi:hypothetical protein